MFIQTESMANPAAMKFLPGRQVLSGGRLELRDRREAVKSPLALRLFDISGVTEVTLGSDCIIVAVEHGDWRRLKPMVLGAIMDHFSSGAPALVGDAGAGADGNVANCLADQVTNALRRVIDPELGENIVDLGLVYEVDTGQGGAVRVTMTTTTPGCPATSYLVEGAREAALSVPEVMRADVKLTYEPRWTPDRMSPEAKVTLGMRDGGDL